MSFQGNQGEVDPLVGVGHEIPGADDGEVVQLTQIQIAQIVSNAVSQELTHQMQQIRNSPPSAIAANHVTQNTTAAQQFETPIKFDVVVVVVFFTLTDRASTIPSNTRGCQSGTWSAGQKKDQRNIYQAPMRAKKNTNTQTTKR